MQATTDEQGVVTECMQAMTDEQGGGSPNACRRRPSNRVAVSPVCGAPVGPVETTSSDAASPSAPTLGSSRPGAGGSLPPRGQHKRSLWLRADGAVGPSSGRRRGGGRARQLPERWDRLPAPGEVSWPPGIISRHLGEVSRGLGSRLAMVVGILNEIRFGTPPAIPLKGSVWWRETVPSRARTKLAR